MNDEERYLFDLNGYLLVQNCLDEEDRLACLAAADQLEGHFASHSNDELQHKGFAGIHYRFDEEYQCHFYKNTSGGGAQYIVDDFLNASSAFDALVNHEKTMGYVREFIAGPVRIGSSELRYRYKANHTDTHMGGKMDVRNRYQFIGRTMYDTAECQWRPRDFDLVAVRVLYALHDIPVENGPLSVVPGSHKSNFFSPFSPLDPTQEPGMVPLPMKAGDAIFFTENLRHGGFPNVVDRVRKTLHLMIGPDWAGSQSPIHWNESVHVAAKAWDRYSESQRAILPRPRHGTELELRRLRSDIDGLAAENLRLRQEIQRRETERQELQRQAMEWQKTQQAGPQIGPRFMKSLRKILDRS
jgi:hypothetical protein